MRDLAAIVKAYDIRGLVPDQLDEQLAHDLGRAAAVELGGTELLVGHDMRPSSQGLSAAFMAGAREAGVDTADLGLCSTDLVSYASGALGAPAVMVTASHNPASYNGFKFCRAGAEPVSLETGLAAIRDRVGVPHPPPAPAPDGAHRRLDLLGEYAEHCRSFVDPARLRGLRVAVDAGNGMAGHVLPAVFEGLPFTVVPLYFELDGTFPNHPADPLDPANLVDLAAAVREEGCDVGLAFDGDADRVFAVDESGAPVSSSLVIAAIAERLLAEHPGETILYNVICSKAVGEVVTAAGGRARRTRVGHSYVKAEMARTGAVFAGEHSGHYYFRDNYRADSGAIAGLLLLEALSVSNAPMSELVRPYQRYAGSGEHSVAVDDLEAALGRVQASLAGAGSIERLDGLTVDAGAWWCNIRPSNTEPLLRINVEAADASEVDAVLARVLDAVGAQGAR